MLVNEPRNIEQKIHSALSEKREGKEWFRCEIHEALEVIHAVSGTEVLLHGTKVPPEPQVAGQGATGSKDVGTSAAVKTGKYSRTATYSGKCSHCGEQFTVTLTRYDSGARCPSCFRRNDTSHFELREFVI
jgi:DNA-directed RNA polymerase subunit RPC12/RpoP